MPSKTGGVVNFKDDGKGHLTSVSASTPTIFTFDLEPLSDFGNLKATFDFNATETGFGKLGNLVVGTFDGSFDFYYAGKTTTVDSITLTKGELLLKGSFKNAALIGRLSASGASLADDSITGVVTYSSAIPQLDLPLVPHGQSFTLGFIGISPLLAVQKSTIRHFTAIGDGKFSSDVVPEPGTWTLALMGMAGIGLGLRRRLRPAATAA